MLKTDYPVVNKIVSELADSLKETLRSNLKGLYIFGSVVSGDFNEETSDIDLLAIVEHVTTDAELQQLQSMHTNFTKKYQNWDDRIEIAYVSVSGMRHYKTKTNKIARISPGEPLHFRDMNIDWLTDWYMVQEQGLTVYGPPPQQFLPFMSSDELIECLKKILVMVAASANEARKKGHQSYIVTLFCRNLYAIEHGKQTSKIKGAQWAASKYPQWSDFILEALSWQGSKDRADSIETQHKMKEFIKFALGEAATPATMF